MITLIFLLILALVSIISIFIFGGGIVIVLADLAIAVFVIKRIFFSKKKKEETE